MGWGFRRAGSTKPKIVPQSGVSTNGPMSTWSGTGGKAGRQEVCHWDERGGRMVGVFLCDGGRGWVGVEGVKKAGSCLCICAR